MRGVSVEVSTKGVAFVVLEGTRRLVDWGRFSDPEKLREVLRRLQPKHLIVEDLEGSRKGESARRLAAALTTIAEQHGLRVIAAAWRPSSKYETTDHMVACFPELRHVRPRHRERWATDRPSVSLFVALARGRRVHQMLERYSPNHFVD